MDASRALKPTASEAEVASELDPDAMEVEYSLTKAPEVISTPPAPDARLQSLVPSRDALTASSPAGEPRTPLEELLFTASDSAVSDVLLTQSSSHGTTRSEPCSAGESR